MNMNDEPTQVKDQQKFSRRAILTKVKSFIGFAAVQAFLPTTLACSKDAPADPTKVPGASPRSYGQRSAFESAHRSTQCNAVANSSSRPSRNDHSIRPPL